MKKKVRKMQLSRETLVSLSTVKVAGIGNDYFATDSDCAPECINCRSWCGIEGGQMICGTSA